MAVVLIVLGALILAAILAGLKIHRLAVEEETRRKVQAEQWATRNGSSIEAERNTTTKDL